MDRSQDRAKLGISESFASLHPFKLTQLMDSESPPCLDIPATNLFCICIYLEVAYKQALMNTGVLSNLWAMLGRMDEAQTLLVEIPEAGDELGMCTFGGESTGVR